MQTRDNRFKYRGTCVAAAAPMSKTGGLSIREVKSFVLIMTMAQSMLTYSRTTVTLEPCGLLGRRMCCQWLVGKRRVQRRAVQSLGLDL